MVIGLMTWRVYHNIIMQNHLIRQVSLQEKLVIILDGEVKRIRKLLNVMLILTRLVESVRYNHRKERIVVQF